MLQEESHTEFMSWRDFKIHYNKSVYTKPQVIGGSHQSVFLKESMKAIIFFTQQKALQREE